MPLNDFTPGSVGIPTSIERMKSVLLEQDIVTPEVNYYGLIINIVKFY